MGPDGQLDRPMRFIKSISFSMIFQFTRDQKVRHFGCRQGAGSNYQTVAKQLSLNQLFIKPPLQTEESLDREEKRDKTGLYRGMRGKPPACPHRHASVCTTDPTSALTIDFH